MGAVWWEEKSSPSSLLTTLVKEFFQARRRRDQPAPPWFQHLVKNAYADPYSPFGHVLTSIGDVDVQREAAFLLGVDRLFHEYDALLVYRC